MNDCIPYRSGRFVAGRLFHVMLACASSGLLSMLTGCTPLNAVDQANRDLLERTGLHQDEVASDGSSAMLTKTHRDYPVLVYSHVGNVWGRDGVRVSDGDVGTHITTVVRFATGQGEDVKDGSRGPYESALSDVIGQPISLVVVLKHGKDAMPRFDILSSFATANPIDLSTPQGALGFFEEKVYCSNESFAARVLSNSKLRTRLGKYQSEYIRADADTVSFLFAGTEDDVSAMVGRHGDYPSFLVSIMDSLADIADTATYP